MAANVQFNSYFPGYYYTASSLSLNANGSSWQLNCDNESRNVYSTAFLSRDYILAHNKQVLKHTMLKQETVFRAQIEELHRLYTRQRELMEEVRRNEFNNYLKSEASHSNLAFYQVASDYVRKNFQAPALSEKACSTMYSVQGNGVQSSESKCKTVGKKILDLQLPADEYIDCDEKELSNTERVSQMLNYAVNNVPQVSYTGDVKPFFGANKTSLMEQSGSSCNGFSSPAGHGMSYGSSKLNSFVNSDKLPPISTKSLHKDFEQTFQLGNQSLSIERTMYGSQSLRVNTESLHGSIFDGQMSLQMNKKNSESVQIQSGSEPPHRNPVAVQALPCFNKSAPLDNKRYELASLERPELGHERAKGTCSSSKTVPECTSEFNNAGKDVKKKGKGSVLDLNMACDSVPESESDELVIEKKDRGFGRVIDLNSFVSEPDAAENELDAPSSPENKECSPPRGESDGNQVDADPPLDDEPARIAATTIVSFSSSTCVLRETPSSSYSLLDWFAGVVCSTAGEEGEMDHVETMALKLVETKTEECCYKSNKCVETGVGRRRGRQQKRKDFQTRYEDLQSVTRSRRNSSLSLVSSSGEGWAKVTRRRRGQRCPVRPYYTLYNT